MRLEITLCGWSGGSETDRLSVRISVEVNSNSISDYQLVVSPKDGCQMPAVASNLGNKSYPDDPAATTNAGNSLSG